MPKVIPDLRRKILSSARGQLKECGFSGLSLRTVAQHCNIAVGTTYNYFPSKIDLVNTVLQEEWNKELDQTDSVHTSAEEALLAVFRGIRSFSLNYSSLIRSEDLRTEYMRMILEARKKVLQDLSVQLTGMLESFGYHKPEGRIRMLATIVLSCAMDEAVQEEEFLVLIHKLFS